jgi:hypothetical protein
MPARRRRAQGRFLRLLIVQRCTGFPLLVAGGVQRSVGHQAYRLPELYALWSHSEEYPDGVVILFISPGLVPANVKAYRRGLLVARSRGHVLDAPRGGSVVPAGKCRVQTQAQGCGHCCDCWQGLSVHTLLRFVYDMHS